jgi:hypothetical protein
VFPFLTSFRRLFWSISLPLLVLAYVLSMGPVLWTMNRHMMRTGEPYPESAMMRVNAFYAPVTWLHNHTQLHAPLETYLSWWLRPSGS